MTVTPVTYIRPDALIFTGVSIRKVTPVTYIRPDALIFTAVIHKEGDTSDIHKT